MCYNSEAAVAYCVGREGLYTSLKPKPEEALIYLYDDGRTLHGELGSCTGLCHSRSMASPVFVLPTARQPDHTTIRGRA